MKKNSVLVKRAWLFTAIVLLAAVAALLLTTFLVNHAFVRNDARGAALTRARLLAAAYDDGARTQGLTELLNEEGGWVYLARGAETTAQDGAPQLAPEAIKTAEQLNGGEALTDFRVGLRRWACAMASVSDGAVIVVVPFSTGRAVLCVGLGAAAAVLVAFLLFSPLSDKLLGGVVRPLVALRDTASAVAEGNLDLRANEDAPDEIGQLGASINRVSTQLSRNMYQLILERNRLRNMLDGLSEGIVAVDRAGQITHTNPALERLFTRQKPKHYPDPRMKVVPNADVWEDFDQVIKTGETLSRSLDVRDMNLKLTITPIVDELGAIVGAVGLFSDVTQQERLERTRRDYVSNISHELRTPLTAMRALIEPLKEGMVTKEEDRQRYYDIILREVMRLSRLINDQLELSRLQSGTLAIEKSRVALDDLIYDVCERYRTIAQERGLALEVQDDLSRLPSVWTNPDRVEQLLIILLDNAMKYTPSGSVGINGAWDDEKVTLTVWDTGVGIEENELPYVFDRFYKVDKAHSGQGSGLGLSIANELLKRMGEDIWVASESGKGTEFSFTLHRSATEESA